MQCERSGCDSCETFNSLQNLEWGIDNLKEKIAEIELDVDTWAYTIMGNKEAKKYWYKYMTLRFEQIMDLEHQEFFPEPYAGNYKLPDEFNQTLIDRCYDKLLDLASKQDSRLVYQVLGVFLMKFGAKMTEKVKELILKNSEWEDDQEQLKNDQDRKERKKYLFDFAEKVKNYKEGQNINVPWGEFSSIDRNPIDYRILKKISN